MIFSLPYVKLFKRRILSGRDFRSIVVDHLNELFKDKKNVSIACIYCNYREQIAQTPVNLLASLWMQLVSDRDSLSKDVIDLYKEHVKRGTRPALDEISVVLRSAIGSYSKVFIVIDALDECPEEKGFRASLLAELIALETKVRLMVTSRPHVNGEQEFQNAIRLDVIASDDDVRRYLKGRIPREPRLVRIIKQDTALQKNIVDTIVKNVQGMFVYPDLPRLCFTLAPSYSTLS
jgi:hypothetical protein